MVYIKMKHFDFKEFSTFLNQGGGAGATSIIYSTQSSVLSIRNCDRQWIEFFFFMIFP